MNIAKINQLLYHDNPLNKRLKDIDLHAKKTTEQVMIQSKMQKQLSSSYNNSIAYPRLQIITLPSNNHNSMQHALKISDISSKYKTPMYSCISPDLQHHIRLQNIDQELHLVQEEKHKNAQLAKNASTSAEQNHYHDSISQLTEIETMLLAAKHGAIRKCLSPDYIPKILTENKQQIDENTKVLVLVPSNRVNTLKNLLKTSNTNYTVQSLEDALSIATMHNYSTPSHRMNHTSSAQYLQDQCASTQLL
ncbi:hypothetical protein CAXC1_220023 [Candidatus Xenohaliotis californiensis]|uniref:Uncharacterized protein n=1 Tax=Candidatus Xenohaliotis californiensis TaxID=84677 RepID=A0ABP0EVQ9_9RICK|nr:hypothetical protein CAXC1_220023 [Candidatus Xenohaliotis californiensis]